ncbi:MAG: hypothetical protein P4M11_05350 [Candidatus Pacebacteria bacterium]|nr:hypothetical protein [Candidatus Paceibacterota bacterium]
MQKIERVGYLFFILTYVSVFAWFYRGVTSGYNFCLPSNDPFNILALIAGVGGIGSLIAYSRHGRRSMRALGIITFAFGVTVALTVILRYFLDVSVCG